MIRNGVTFGEKHSLDDYGLIFMSKTISAPEPQTKLVEIPGRNGAVDLSEVLTGDVRYNNRKITIKFAVKEMAYKYTEIGSILKNELHGARMRVIFDDDIAFYWIGRISVDGPVVDGGIGIVTVEVDADPYKFTIQSTEEEWLWDPFDFEQGIINELGDITVSGTKEVSIIGSKKYVNPTITVTGSLSVTYNGQTYALQEGSQVLYDIILTEGEDILTFTGTGTVSINVVGGSL